MNAVHTMVVFTDYECKACRDLDESIRQVLEAHPHKLAVVIRHNPLRSIHPVAELAANAAACAARLGSFAAYHRVLFEVQDSLRAMEWGRWAARAGIADTSALVDCVSERGGRMDVVTDINLAKVIDLRRSPSVLLDGAILGSQPSAHQIEAELLRDPR
jgi:protein-disulfide isomerase